MWTDPVYESLVKALHCSLQLTALVLPLLIVPDRLQRGPLPRGGSVYVIDEVHAAHRVCATLPATTQAHNSKSKYCVITVLCGEDFISMAP